MRLFVAVNLPESERQAVWSAARPLRDAGLPVRWVAERSLHITLKFLGEVDNAQAEPIAAALTAAVQAVKPFDLVCGGFGAFPDTIIPRTLWYGVERHPALELLANDVERALKPLGFQPELRPFAPHLTLGRVHKPEPGSFRQLETLAAQVEYSGVMTVTSADVMKSVQGRGGPEYYVQHRAPLGGSQ